jgi:stage II sporulation protein Q
MNEQNKEVQETNGTRESKHAVPAVAPSFSWKRMLGKKWVFPAVYMAAAAIILTLMWVYQDSAGNKVSEDAALNQTVTDNVTKPAGDAVAVSAQAESMQWPVKDQNQFTISMPFYEEKASDDVKQAALVEYGETFQPHLGIDLASKDNKDFDVMAAMSGKVSLVEKNPLVGYQVEITHSNGLITVYQSLSDIKVTKGQDVKKGDIIAMSGKSELEKDHGNHLHFEVRQGADGQSVNPDQFLTTASTSSNSTNSNNTPKATDKK